MLLDGLLLFSQAQDLTALAAGTPGASTNVLDLLNPRDLGVTDPLMVFGVFNVLPASGTGGATFTAALQTSPDNATWTTVETFGPVTISNVTAQAPYAFRQQLPITGVFYRYLRMLYTASAAFTGGQFESGLALEVQAAHVYPRNFSA